MHRKTIKGGWIEYSPCLSRLIKRGESQSLEFKLKPDEDLGKTICSFANTNGGIILIGISDDKEIMGCSGKQEQRIANTAHSCKSSVYPEIRESNLNGKNIFMINVKKSSQIHSFKNIAYKRVGSHNKPLSPEEVIEFAKSSGRIRWDEQICRGASLQDIDEEKVRWFLKRAVYERRLDIGQKIPMNEILKRFGLINKVKPTNAAILMFSKEPQRFFLQAETRCARFKGTEPVKPFVDMKVIQGTLYEQIDGTEKFILNNIKKAAWIELGKIERQEEWEYPLNALREAVTNAICHRDYNSNANVQIRIFDDRMEIWNPGKLPEGLTIEKLKKKHESKPQNPLIAKLFFMIKYIEQWGTGTNKMIQETIKHGLPEPEFEDTGNSFIVTLRKSKLTGEYLEKLELNERQKKALDYIKERGRITRKEYVKISGISLRMANMDLKDLEGKKLIKRTGSGRSAHYVLA